MSLLRTAVVLRSSPTMITRAGIVARQQARGAHFENVKGHNFPFEYSNKRAFTLWYWTIMSVAFATPFVAAKYQLFKSSHL